MFRSSSKLVVNFSIILSLIFLGCKDAAKQVQINKPEQKTVLQTPVLSGEHFGYLKNILIKDGNYFASVVFIERQIKNEEQQQKSVIKFADSLEVFELPNEYFVAVKGKNFEQFLINASARIVMQTFSRNALGNYKFNEIIDRDQLYKLFATKEVQRFSQIPFKFNLQHNTIQSIEEKYIP